MAKPLLLLLQPWHVDNQHSFEGTCLCSHTKLMDKANLYFYEPFDWDYIYLYAKKVGGCSIGDAIYWKPFIAVPISQQQQLELTKLASYPPYITTSELIKQAQ